MPLFTHEVLGRPRLDELAGVLYPPGEDPSAIISLDKPYSFKKHDGGYAIRLLLPFAAKGEIGLFKKGDELIVQVGSVRRHIGLPSSMADLMPVRAHLEGKVLTIEMRDH